MTVSGEVRQGELDASAVVGHDGRSVGAAAEVHDGMPTFLRRRTSSSVSSAGNGLMTIRPSVFHVPTGEKILFAPTDGHAGAAFRALEPTATVSAG